MGKLQSIKFIEAFKMHKTMEHRFEASSLYQIETTQDGASSPESTSVSDM